MKGISELTKCNYCSLQSIRSRARSHNWSVRLDTEESWVRVLVDNVPVAWFMELTDHCVC